MTELCFTQQSYFKMSLMTSPLAEENHPWSKFPPSSSNEEYDFLVSKKFEN
jgi:hypothetical protein